MKPEFWVDEKLTECSLSARLLFIGSFNFADDNGNMVASAKRLKMQVFPADSIDVQPLVDELIAHGLLIEYSVNGKKYWHIKGFKKHQKINRPSNSDIPQPQLSEGSVSDHEGLIDGREGKGRERNKNITSTAEAEDSPQADSDQQQKPPDCPHQQIIDLYHEHCPTMRQVKIWNGERRKHMQARWRESPKHQSLEFWARFFQYANSSDFLRGETGKFAADLEWLIRPSNFAKVVEGKYNDDKGAA